MHLCLFQVSVMISKITPNGRFYDLRDICHLKNEVRAENKSVCLLFMSICPASLMGKKREYKSLETNTSPFCNSCLSDHAQNLK